MNFKFFFLFFKRGIKSNILTSLFNILILSLLGIIIISAVIPFNVYARNQLEDYNLDTSVLLTQRSMKDLSYEAIISTFNSISLVNGNSDFVICFPLLYQKGEEIREIMFMSISDGLYNLFQLKTGEIISTSGLSTGKINVTSEENSANFTLKIDRIEYLNWENKILEQIFFLVQKEYNQFLFSSIIVSNTSLGSILVENLEISSDKLLAEVLVFFDEGWTKELSFNEIDEHISDQEKYIFQQLIKEGIEANLIEFHSPIKKILNDLSAKIEDQTYLIQILSIPSFLFAIILIFILEFGANKLIKKDGKILWSKGISIQSLKILYWVLEIVIDIIGLLITQIIFSIIITILGLQIYLHLHLFVTFTIITIIFILVKVFRYIRIERNILQHEQSKEKIQFNKKKEKRIERSKLIRNSIFISVIVVFLVQIFRIFEPIFFYPFFSGVVGIIFNWITYLTLLFVFAYLVLSITRYTIKQEKSLNLSRLVKRLFQRSLKKLRVQRIISVGLFCLIVFLLIYETSYINYENKRFVDENQLNDIFFHDQIFYGFDFNNVSSLKEKIPDIKETYPLQSGICSIFGEEGLVDAQVIVINCSKYTNKDLGWNHMIGSSNSEELNNIFSNFSQKSIIINQKTAEITSLREGDSFSIDLEIFLKNQRGYINSRLDNLTAVAIVDTLPFTQAFVNDKPYVFIDISNIFEIMEQKGLDKFISSFGVDVFFSVSSSRIEKKEKTEEIIKSIIQELEISSATLDIESKYGSEQEEENIAIIVFIIFNIVFIILFLPFFVVVFSKNSVKTIVPSLRQLVSRGYSIKALKKKYTMEIYTYLFSSTFLGVSLGIILALSVIKVMYPWMLLATDLHLLVQITIRILLTIAGSVLSSLIIIPLVTKPISTILEKNYRKEE